MDWWPIFPSWQTQREGRHGAQGSRRLTAPCGKVAGTFACFLSREAEVAVARFFSREVEVAVALTRFFSGKAQEQGLRH